MSEEEIEAIALIIQDAAVEEGEWISCLPAEQAALNILKRLEGGAA